MPSPRRKFRTKINTPAAGTFSANHKSAKKKLHPKGWSLCWRYLFSQPVARQLSSAQMSLTSVFGMGTGGPSSQSTPTIYFYRLQSRSTLSTSLLYRAFHLCQALFFALLKRAGDPYRIRTDVNGVRGHCLNHLTNGPCPASSIFKAFRL